MALPQTGVARGVSVFVAEDRGWRSGVGTQYGLAYPSQKTFQPPRFRPGMSLG
jgi:hypothetical protein